MMSGGALMTRTVDFISTRETLRYSPARIKNMEQLRHEMKLIIGARAGIFAPKPGRKFVTFGSCFATNVANALNERGADVYTSCITEDVNSTYNNRLLLRRVFLKEESPFTQQLRDMTGIDYEELCSKFFGATDIIFTLGNIFHLFDDMGNAVVAKKGSPLAKESYAETVDSLREILRLLMGRTRANVFASVSPVPVSGYRGPDFASVMEADCASKCQLQTALRSMSGYTYIPTFEIFRWLAAHQDFATFGDGGNHPRHITKEHIAMVMEILCSKE